MPRWRPIRRPFPCSYVNMVQVGENSGTLDAALARLADFLEEQVRLRARIRAAMAYPILMAVVGVGVLFFLLSFVVPKVTRMLTDLDQALPLPTQVLITLSDFLSSWWWLLLILAGAALILFDRYRRTPAGRLNLDRLVLRLPLFGRLNLLLATARFSRTLSTLLASGVPLLKALEIARNLLQNQVLADVVAATTDAVREGEVAGRAAQAQRRLPADGGADGGDRRAKRRTRRDAAAGGRRLRTPGGNGHRRHALAARTADDPGHGQRRRLHRHGHPAADLPGQPGDGIE